MNPYEGSTAFFRQHWIWMELLGESFWLAEYLARSTPQELYILPPDQVRIAQDKNTGYPIGYRYTIREGVGFDYSPREIYHSKYFNPSNAMRGLAPLEAAQLPAGVEFLTQKHWQNVMKRGGFLTGILTSEGYVDPEHMEDIKRQWDRLYGGVEGTRSSGIAYLQGNTKYQQIGLTPHDADYVEQAKLTREQICEAFRVPKTLIGVVEDANYSNAQEMTFSYFVQTIFPKLRLLEEDLNEIVLPRFGDGYVAKFDIDSIPIVQEMYLNRAQKLSALAGGPILTRNEAREFIDRRPLMGGDQILEPSAYGPGPIARPEPARSRLASPTKFINDPERMAKRQTVLVGMESYEKEALADWKGHLDKQEARVLRKFQAQAKAVSKAPDFTEIYDDELELEMTRQLVLKILLEITGKQGQRALNELPPSSADEFLVSDPAVMDWLEAQAYAEGVLVQGRTATLLSEAYNAAVEAGATVQEITSAISEMFELRRFESARIARTEASRAYNFSTHAAWQQSGIVESQQWLTAGDEAVRDAHADADGQVAGMGEAFDVGGESLEYPGDPAGSAENVINCRCGLMAQVMERQRNGTNGHGKLSGRLAEYFARERIANATHGG